MTKNWKDHFLQSGVPLEHSVKQKFQEIEQNQIESLGLEHVEKDLLELVNSMLLQGVDGAKKTKKTQKLGHELKLLTDCQFVLREYQYDRIDENGNITTFSVDISTKKAYKNVDLHILIECKYRYPSVKWIFCPEEHVLNKNWEHIKYSYNWYVTEVSDFCKEYEINRDFWKDNFYVNYQHCYKGAEILPDKFNPKGIKQAFHQLSYAVPNKISDILERELFSNCYINDKITIILPIIVTTADLWCINPGVSMAGLYESKSIEDIATQKDILMVHSMPDNQLKKYTNQTLLKIFNKEKIQIFNEKNMHQGGENYLDYIDMFGSCDPSIFFVIKYDNFKEEMMKILNFFENEEILKKRT